MTLVTSSNLHNHALLFTELRLLQATIVIVCKFTNRLKFTSSFASFLCLVGYGSMFCVK